MIILKVHNKGVEKNSTYLEIKLTNGKEVNDNKTLLESNLYNFKYRKGDFQLISPNDNSISPILYVGSKGVISENDWLELGFNLVKYLENNFPDIEIVSINNEINEKSGSFIEGLISNNNQFLKYKINKKKRKDIKILLNTNMKLSKIQKMIKEKKRKIKGMFLTRNLIETTPNEANSKTILKVIKKQFKIDDKSNLVKIKVYKEKDLKNLKMNGHLAVNKASKNKAMTIRLTITPKNYKKHIVFVGKGLTYDTGGLSLKPSNSMCSMKADKGGAMTCLGVMDSLKYIGSDNKITMYLALAENSIGSKAYRNDDIITMKNGRTVHVKNTDAEGRIVLYDNLCLAQEENNDIDEIYTLATLTGAAIYQFGDESTGMVGLNEKMKKRIKKIGKRNGENFMNAELNKYIMNANNDSLADLNNVGDYSSTKGMGCQKAGLFLLDAITKKNKNKYLHLDIAGPAYIPSGFSIYPKGATGWGVRTLFDMLKK